MSRLPTPKAVMLRAGVDAMRDGEFSMGKVAKRAGITRQALYLHFDGLADLAMACARYSDEELDVAGELAPVHAATDGRTMLRELAAFWGRFNPKIGDIVMSAIHLARTHPSVQAALDDRRAGRVRAMTGAVAKLNEWGELRDGWDEHEAAQWLDSQGSVALWHEQTVEAGWSTERYVRLARETLYRNLLRPRKRKR